MILIKISLRPPLYLYRRALDIQSQLLDCDQSTSINVLSPILNIIELFPESTVHMFTKSAPALICLLPGLHVLFRGVE